MGTLVNVEKAKSIATELKKQNKGGYWEPWYLWQLTGWILHKGICVYCDRDNDISDPRKLPPRKLQTTDHLLPQCKYPELDKEPLNHVPSCSICNVRKQGFDPSEGTRLTRDDLMVEATRNQLIKKARDFISTNNPVPSVPTSLRPF
jgi:hypothetical protein